MPKIYRDLVRRPWWSLALHVVPFLLLAAFPVVYDSESAFGGGAGSVILIVQIYLILALGLNIVVGYTGLLDLGYVTFLATGAVVTSLILMSVHTSNGWVLPGGNTSMPEGDRLLAFQGGYLIIILIAGLVCAGLGVIRGFPTLKLSGDYYAIVTLGLAEIAFLIYLNEEWLTGGAFGMKLTLQNRPSLFGQKLYYDSKVFFYLVYAILLLTIYAMYRLQNSRLGRAWAAIRLDETAAQACGINVPLYKTIAFAVSGFFGGVGGALYAVWSDAVAVKDLDIWQSIIILCAVVLGGMGSIRGVLLGGAILVSLGEILRLKIGGFRVPPEARYLVYGLMLLILMRFRPQGLLPRSHGGTPPSEQEEQAMRDRTSPLYALGRPKAAK